jgi:sulfur carrier protein
MPMSSMSNQFKNIHKYEKNNVDAEVAIDLESSVKSTTITVVLNNEHQTCESAISVDELAHRYASNIEGTAIAYNHAILSKSQWPITHLKDGDSVDIFTLVAGG